MQDAGTIRRGLTFGAAGIAAAVYPLLLDGFHASLEPGARIGMAAAFWLALCFVPPAIAIWTAGILGGGSQPDTGQLRARRIALIATAAPTAYVFLGVVTYMAGSTIPDTAYWLVFWGLATAYSLSGVGRRDPRAWQEPAAVLPGLRIAHGVGAAVSVALFLGIHLFNHFSALWSIADQQYWMGLFRKIYRAPLVEPALVGILLFQIVSGVYLVARHSRSRSDFFRNLQLCSGVYLAVFITGHMNSVFLYARTFAGIKTDWNFAIGAPAGLIADAWNIRLLPHYILGVTLVLAHLALGARIVALGHLPQTHRASKVVNALTGVAMALAAVVAIAIGAALSGAHLEQG